MINGDIGEGGQGGWALHLEHGRDHDRYDGNGGDNDGGPSYDHDDDEYDHDDHGEDDADDD